MHRNYRRSISRKNNLRIPDSINSIKYTQNKLIWMKTALGIMTTDTTPKMAMEECYIGKTLVKIYGAKIRNDTSQYGDNSWIYFY